MLGLKGHDKEDNEEQLAGSADPKVSLVNRPVYNTGRDEVERQLGARPKRMAVKPKRFEDFETYSTSLMESQFMQLNAVKRKSVVKG